MVAGVLQGFALNRPDRWAHRPDVLLWSAEFQDHDGQPLQSISAEGTQEIRAVSELYLARDLPPITVKLEVYPIRVGEMDSPSTDDVFKSAVAEVQYGPIRTVISAELELPDAPEDALAYAMRWRVIDDDLPFLETHWARYAVFADAPLFRASYADGIRAYLPTVTITREEPITPIGWIRGHTVLPAGHRGTEAQVTSSAGVVASSHPGGGFYLGSHDPGTVTLTATATGHLGGPVEVEVEAGIETVARLDLRAVPIVDGAEWSLHTDRLGVVVQLGHFPEPPTELEVIVRREGESEPLGTWTGPAETGSVEVAFETPQIQGTRLVPSASVDGGDVVVGGVVTIDSTPPGEPDAIAEADPDAAADAGPEADTAAAPDGEAEVDGGSPTPSGPEVGGEIGDVTPAPAPRPSSGCTGGPSRLPLAGLLLLLAVQLWREPRRLSRVA